MIFYQALRLEKNWDPIFHIFFPKINKLRRISPHKEYKQYTPWKYWINPQYDCARLFRVFPLSSIPVSLSVPSSSKVFVVSDVVLIQLCSMTINRQLSVNHGSHHYCSGMNIFFLSAVNLGSNEEFFFVVEPEFFSESPLIDRISPNICYICDFI